MMPADDLVKVYGGFSDSLKTFGEQEEFTVVKNILDIIESRQSTDHITWDLIQKTGIGKRVNSFRKVDGECGELARKLVLNWKQIVNDVKPKSTTDCVKDVLHDPPPLLDPNRIKKEKSPAPPKKRKSDSRHENHSSEKKHKHDKHSRERSRSPSQKPKAEQSSTSNVEVKKISDVPKTPSPMGSVPPSPTLDDPETHEPTGVESFEAALMISAPPTHPKPKKRSSDTMLSEKTVKKEKIDDYHSKLKSPKESRKDKSDKHSKSSQSDEKSKSKKSHKEKSEKPHKNTESEKSFDHQNGSEKRHQAHHKHKEENGTQSSKENSEQRHRSSSKEKTKDKAHHSKSKEFSKSDDKIDRQSSKNKDSTDSSKSKDHKSKHKHKKDDKKSHKSSREKSRKEKKEDKSRQQAVTERVTKPTEDPQSKKLLQTPLPTSYLDNLPELSTEYNPGPRVRQGFEKPQVLRGNMEYEINSKKEERSAVYSGKHRGLSKVFSLKELCVRILIANIEDLGYVGHVPFDILKPVIEKATMIQLYNLEEYNPSFTQESDDLWKAHVERDFRGQKPQELESNRECYLRLYDEREEKLNLLKTRIAEKSQRAADDTRKAKVAYSALIQPKPPKDVRRKQMRYGTGSGSLESTARADSMMKVESRDKRINPVHTPASVNKQAKVIAPLMMKAKKFMSKMRR